MIRIRTAIVALAMMIASTLVVLATSTPAEAASRGVCRDAYGKTVCVTVYWQPNGVVVTGVNHSTPSGCSSLGSPRYIYKDVQTSNRYYHLTSLDCGSTLSMYDGCGTCTSRTVKVWLKANVPYDFDYEYGFTFYLRRDGSSDVSTSLNLGGLE
jgi:hypothetical protein